MLRIHLTFEDLARVRIAETAHRGTEVLFSLHVLHTRTRDLRFHRWLRAARRTSATTFLTQLYAPECLPAFLCPLVEPDWRDTAYNVTRSDPDMRRFGLRRIAAVRGVTPFAQALADDERQARDLFARALGAYQRISIDAWMPHVDALVCAERREWARLAAAGPGHLLQNLHPQLSWAPPTLSVHSARDGDVHLNGRGLVIQPTVFGVDRPWVAGHDAPGFETVLFVPLRRLMPLDVHETEAPESLVRLLGRTRATVLGTLADGEPSGTGEIARRLDCSPATVSDHTAVLRDSGLITTVRDGQSVQHTVTHLGAELLRGSSA